MVLGSGEVAERTVQAFQSRGAYRITVSSRTFEKACELAERFGGTAIHFEHFRNHLHEYDVVVSSTSAPGTILSQQFLRNVVHQRPSRPLFLIDLAIPRDIEPAAGQLNNVFLYNLDDLAAIANENLASRMEDVDNIKRAFSRKAWQVWLNIVRRTPVTGK